MEVQNNTVAQMTVSERVRAIFASSSGNLVEWYDFYAYSFSAIYFAKAFFPKGDQTTQLLQTAAIFAVGFFMRPIGSWFFGTVADRKGRRFSMVLAVMLMCFGSFMMAILPTYQTIGIAAPILLLIARLIQGFSVGGEYGTAATYMSEVASSNRRGFFSSFQYVTLIGGQLLASLMVVLLLFFLNEQQMHAWGWRIPFLIGGVLGVVALYLRRTLVESADESVTSRKEAGSFSELMKHWKAFATVVGITAGGSLVFYTFTTYMQKYLVNTVHLSKPTATNIMTIALFIYMIVQPLFGMLSDKIGRRNNMLMFGALGALTTVPIMFAIKNTQDTTLIFMLIMAAMLWISLYTSISGILKAELFPMEVRALGVGLSYAVGNSLFGGSAEYVALQLKEWGHEPWFYYYVAGMLAISFIASWMLPDNRQHSTLNHDYKNEIRNN